MSWTPTEGQRRADALMREMFESAQSLGIPVATGEFPMHHHRVFTLIAAAIDQALTDGAAQEALALATLDGAIGNGHDVHEDALNQLAGLDGWRNMPAATADPVGFEPHSELIARHGVSVGLEEGMAHPDGGGIVGQDVDSVGLKIVAPQAKRRGRPKGSKGKAKKAKAPKKAKAASFEEPSEVEFVAPEAAVEALANGSAEPPAEAPPA